MSEPLQSTGEEDQDDLYEHIRITADKGQEPLRVDKFLMNRVEKVSRNRIQLVAKAGLLRVNNTPVKVNYKVKPGDTVSVLLTTPGREFTMEAENIPLDVLYEDDDLVVINKAVGMVVHPGSGNYTGTLVHALMYHFDHLPVKDDNTRPGLVHRLDKNTSGLMVVAKNEYAMTHLWKQFFDRTIKRRYIAIVWGDFEEEEGTVEGHIGRDLRYRKKMAVYPDGDYGKPAITHYRVLERLGYITVVECRLETGRTHQIRVHMEYLKHPVFNDDFYGGDRIVKGTVYTKYKQFVENCFKICPRHALHARVLGFEHPVTGQQLLFEQDIPEDMGQLLEKWRRYVRHNTNIG